MYVDSSLALRMTQGEGASRVRVYVDSSREPAMSTANGLRVTRKKRGYVCVILSERSDRRIYALP